MSRDAVRSQFLPAMGVKRTLILSLLGAGALAVLWGASPLRHAAMDDASAASEPEATLAPAPVRDRRVLATGLIEAMVGARVRVGSRASGVVARIHGEVGDAVRAGEVLAELDAREFEMARDMARAELDVSLAELEFARLSLARREELLGSASTLDELQRAQSASEVARARVRRDRAALQQAEIRLGYTRILAPIDGVIAEVSTQVGETIAASFAAPTFMTLIDLERLELWAYVDETDIGRIEVGRAASFTVDTWFEREFGGRVRSIHPTAISRDNVVNYIVTLTIDGLAQLGPETLRPGMTVLVRIDVADEGEGTLAAGDGRSDSKQAREPLREPRAPDGAPAPQPEETEETSDDRTD